MPTITLPDGSQKVYDNASVTGAEIAASIGAGLAKAAIAIEVNGEEWDLCRPITKDAKVKIFTLKDERGLDAVRHSLTAQVLARAVKELYPSAKLAIGPTIEHGAYYDIAFEEPISSDDLPKIEAKMHEIIKRGQNVVRLEWPAEKVKQYFADKAEDYKVMLVEGAVEKGELFDGERLSVYVAGDDASGESFDFLDLCRGPHVSNFGQISLAFKLTNLAGAYWRGDSCNEQLTRIYMVAFPTQKELDAHLHMLEEAAKRDHRKLGKELGIYHMEPEAIGVGLPLWLPNGTIIRDELEKWAREEEHRDGYQRVVTPILAKENLYYQSGHLPYYAEDMYAPIDIEGEKYYLRPMNCPHHHYVYSHKPRSYRELPLRIAEYGNVFRYEASGALSGLMRARGFCQNDAHIYCRHDQAKEEFLKVMRLHERFYQQLGITDFYMRLSLPDMDNLGKYVDDADGWRGAAEILREAMKESGYPFKEVSGEAAFYGPKIDFQIKSAIGVEYTISTNQLDFLATKRFNLTYKGEDGQQHPVYVIHRAPLGSHERFVGFLLEHFAGAMPLWLAPTQVVLMGVTEKQSDAVQERVSQLLAANVRAEADLRNEKINYKIREHSVQKVPLIGVIGDKEIENGTITLRRLGSEQQFSMNFDEFLAQTVKEIQTRALSPAHESEKAAA